MSTPVVTDKWAGTLECSECHRKRLMAQEFSKTALDKYRKNNHQGALRCKQCVAAAEQKERQSAATRKTTATLSSSGDHPNTTTTTNETHVCAACQIDKPFEDYNKNQWNKGKGAGRCRACVEQAIEDEKMANERAKAEKIAQAQRQVEQAQKSGNAAAILKAESVLSALQAEQVTGLKPVRMNRGGGGARGGRGRGNGRGRR